MLRVSQFQSLELPQSIRVVAQTTLDGDQRDLWYEFSNRYAPFLTIDRSDALAAALLLECMHRGIDLYLEGPVSATLLGNLEVYSQVMRTLFPALKPIRLHCDEVRYFDSTFQGRQLASSFSCGVDSLFTVQQRLAGAPEHRRLQHLAYFNVGSHGRGRAAADLFRKRALRVGRVAAQLDLPILFVDSNLDEFYTLRFEDSHAARTASAALLFQKLFHTYLLPSTNTYADFGPDGSTPLSDHLLSSDATRFVHDGAHCSRIEKSERLAQWPLTQESIDVCMIPLPAGGNCSRCDKCVRAMITFDMLGVRQKFEGAFNFQQFGARKHQFVARMAKKGIEAPNFYWRELVLHAEKTGYRLFDS
jgi:hypothetical protein